jgi:hypothetical protein
MKTTRIFVALGAALLVSTGDAMAASAHKGSQSANAPNGSAVIGTVESDVRVRRASQSQTGQNNFQEANMGSVVGSAVIGTVRSRVDVREFRQSQSGRNNIQEANIGTIKSSAVIGTVRSRVTAGLLSQDQSGGQSNEQRMNLGSLR